MAKKITDMVCDRGSKGALSCMVQINGSDYGCKLKKNYAGYVWKLDYCNKM